uniref:LON peptidase N-terminal domain and ring finger 1 n=1 Tax=Strigops habroptila TaxID=2489341 RepID=A0A672U3P7_STRHB
MVGSEKGHLVSPSLTRPGCSGAPQQPAPQSFSADPLLAQAPCTLDCSPAPRAPPAPTYAVPQPLWSIPPSRPCPRAPRVPQDSPGSPLQSALAPPWGTPKPSPAFCTLVLLQSAPDPPGTLHPRWSGGISSIPAWLHPRVPQLAPRSPAARSPPAPPGRYSTRSFLRSCIPPGAAPTLLRGAPGTAGSVTKRGRGGAATAANSGPGSSATGTPRRFCPGGTCPGGPRRVVPRRAPQPSAGPGSRGMDVLRCPMFFEPVTTPCGHTFCKECLERCLDHRPNCPLCKQSLREYLKAGSYSPTVLLQDIILATFPSELAERRDLHRAEMAELSNLTKNIPIFVCTMSFPGIPCPLHVFEPRYRLMIRRCQETGTRRFGMCIYEHGKSFADYGCMLEIRQIELLADGRSLVDTIGRRRFRVLSRGHRDGYNTADIEYLEDRKVRAGPGQKLPLLGQSLPMDTFSSSLHHGPLPEKEEDIQASADGPTWCWWLISILPLDPSYQLNLFSTTSLRTRLTQLQRILATMLQQPPEQSLN